MPKANSPPVSHNADLTPNVKFKYDSLEMTDLKSAVAAAKVRFVERNPVPRRLFEEATEYLPGGNTRTLLYSAPFPISMKKGEGYKVFDEDGHV
jgi:glutamate-1-semialdehyde 2,1-aminomutase